MGNENFEILFPVLGTGAYWDPKTHWSVVRRGAGRGGAIRGVLRSTSRLDLGRPNDRAKDNRAR